MPFLRNSDDKNTKMAPFRQLGRHITLYIIAIVAGWIFLQANMPLPWMIGPLVAMACLFLSGIATTPLTVKTRPFGQMVVASSVGTYFTPDVFQTVVNTTPLLIGMALLTALTAVVLSLFSSRMFSTSVTQSVLSTFPISPVEAAVMAERYGIKPATVILPQTVRIAAIVIVVPISIYIVDGWPQSTSPTTISTSFDFVGCTILAALAIAGSLMFRAIRLPNPFFLGALAFSSTGSALGLHLSPYPGEILAIAQIILGAWLGSTFQRKLFADAGRLVLSSVFTTLLLLIANSSIAVLVASMSNMEWETLVLGAAPGGVTEMALTAKYLGINVAIITAFQLTRIFIFMPNIPWVIRLVNKLEQRFPR